MWLNLSLGRMNHDYGQSYEIEHPLDPLVADGPKLPVSPKVRK
jgi:hypothetical protein